MIDTLPVSCPYCGETIELLIDPLGGSHQRYVEDCEVCCRPWSVEVRLGPKAETAQVSVSTLDE